LEISDADRAKTLVGSIFGAEADQGESFDEGSLIEISDDPQTLALSSIDLGLSHVE
jgi:hypothetical protein